MGIRIPSVTWSRPLGLGYDPAPRPRVDTPMIDDGPWGGVPIGGIGSGSIGRTQRGDFARRHLRVGWHEFRPGGIDGFALWVSEAARPTTAVTLRTTASPRGWGPPLDVGSGTYRALFPRAWLEFDLGDLPVRLVEEQLSPVVPGDDAASCLPVGVFEHEITNAGTAAIDVALLFAWRDDLGPLAGGEPGRVELLDEPGVAGLTFRHDGASNPASLSLAAATGGGLDVTRASFALDDLAGVWRGFATDGRVAPTPTGDGEVGAIAVRATLGPGETRSVRVALAWDVPAVEFASGRRWWKRHTVEWGRSGGRAGEIAARGLACLDDWRAAIERWQAPILDSPDRPDWYKAALFNELYYLVDGGTIWPVGPVEPIEPDAPAAPPSDDPGALGILECYDYPFYDTLDVHFYAAFALTALWPALQVSISRAYAATVAIDDPAEIEILATGERAIRKVAGALPHDLGGPHEDPFVRVNHYRFREVNGWKDLNPKFVLQAWRDRTFAPDPDAYVRELWPSVACAMDRVATFDRDGDGLPEHDGRPDQTYDTWPMTGPSAYGGSLWLAALRAAAAFARAVGDEARAAAWDADFERAAASFEARLWNGRSFAYDDGGGPTADSVMADQLVGQWYADVCGLGDLVPPDRVESALRHVFERNVVDFGDGLIGAVNGMRPDGTVDRSSEQSEEVWVGTTYALAAFMIGRGLVADGWTTAEGAARVVWERGLWFRTPEAYDRNGNFRASMYLRPLAIWAIEEALARRARGEAAGRQT